MPTSLNRSLNLAQITLYGVGSIIGAGIYVLLGEVALVSGKLTPLAFLVAAFVVSFSAYSYRHMARRLPYSAGEVVYVQEAFSWTPLAQLVGATIILSGIVSSATLARGFTGYFAILATLPDAATISLLVTLLTALAIWGVRQSVWAAMVTTAIEIFGVALVIWASRTALPAFFQAPLEYLAPTSIDAWSGVGAGAFIAFYAFIGFEDMVNMAEEVKNPKTNLFAGILLALIVTSTLYVVVALCAVTAVDLATIAGAKAPLAVIVERNTDFPVAVMAAISLVAVVNGALLQIIMCSRVAYGMAKRGLAPRRFAHVHPRTQTPALATLTVGTLVLVFALSLPLVTLAKLTSTGILAVFTLVNASLLALNWRDGHRTPTRLLLPLAGAGLCLAFMITQVVT